jgi:circadian clock protein KaiC
MPDLAVSGEFAASGIPGLDHLLRGGFPASRLHLIQGDPGTGKTTLALQFLLTGLAREKRVST